MKANGREVRCWFSDCYEPVRIVIKLHRRDEPLLSTPDMAVCMDHLRASVEMVAEQLLAGEECSGVSVLRA